MDKWVAVLPTLHKKGQSWFYNLEVETTEARTFEI